MDLDTRHLIAGTLVALAIGAGITWQQRSPPRDAAAVAAPAPAPADTEAPAPALYKWLDDQGVWNYTDTPPADRPYQSITGTPNVNSVPSVVPDSGLTKPDALPAP